MDHEVEFFVEKYGAAALAELVAAFQRNESGGSIGRRYNVSRQRVHQWKRAFGVVSTHFEPYTTLHPYLKKAKKS
jgi:hypothetical protein